MMNTLKNYAIKIDTKIKKDQTVELPTNMQIVYAREISDFFGLESELNSLQYNKADYGKFLNKYLKEYKRQKGENEKNRQQ